MSDLEKIADKIKRRGTPATAEETAQIAGEAKDAAEPAVSATVTDKPAEPSADAAAAPAKSASAPAPAAPTPKTDGELVIVEVTKPFQITLVGNVVRRFAVGVQEVDRSIADHWWAKANGMKVFQPTKKE